MYRVELFATVDMRREKAGQNGEDSSPSPRVRKNFVETWIWSDRVVGYITLAIVTSIADCLLLVLILWYSSMTCQPLHTANYPHMVVSSQFTDTENISFLKKYSKHSCLRHVFCVRLHS